MPAKHRSKGPVSARTQQTLMDWVRRLMQLSGVVAILLYVYLFYGLLFGSFGQWTTVTPHSEQLRLVSNVRGAVFWVDVALGILILTCSLLYFDEETLGYTFVGLAVVLYFGMPFLFDTVLEAQVAGWTTAGHPAGIIRDQFRIAAFMLAVPGVLLSIRDVIQRVVAGASGKRTDRSAMQYGAAAREEAPPPSAIVGAFAKCWQLPYCWEAIRKKCPIYLKRVRCWRERVGCMCEENVVRTVMDTYAKEQPEEAPDLSRIDLTQELGSGKGKEPTQVIKPRVVVAHVPPKDIKIPHNPHLPMEYKVQRCRNCVIYNEHQRLKYQFIAPLVLLIIPGLAVLYFGLLNQLLENTVNFADHAVARLSPIQGAHPADIALMLTSSTGAAAQYVLLGSLVVVATSMALRGVEYLVFKLKL